MYQATLYEILFDLQMGVCERFKMNPFQLRKERATEVFLLLKRLEDYNKNEEIRKLNLKKGEKVIRKNGQIIIKRPAQWL